MRRLLIVAAVAFFAVAAFGQWRSPYAPVSSVPAYHQGAPVGPLPPILSGKQLDGPIFQKPWQKAAYRDAAKISPVLYQLPCYCRCDVTMGHTSLRSCFEGLHGAQCETCAAEGIYAYKMTQEGKSVAEIRSGIEHGAYRNIKLNEMH